MAIKLERYFSRIRPHVTGCPDITILETLRLVLRDICQRVNVWTLKDDIYLVKGISEYELLVPDQSDLARVFRTLFYAALTSFCSYFNGAR